MFCLIFPTKEPAFMGSEMSQKNKKQKTIATIGGTFDTLHRGHKEYIRLAFECADHIIIYVNSDEYVKALKSYHVRPYELRIKRLQQFLRLEGIKQNRYEIKVINTSHDHVHELVGADIHYSLIAPDYEQMFNGINEQRLQIGKQPIVIKIKHRVPNLSSTTIRFPYKVFYYTPIATLHRFKMDNRLFRMKLRLYNVITKVRLKTISSSIGIKMDNNIKHEA